jgi:medium-chain acyl-[acyl-carrier-protein] hydrolase
MINLVKMLADAISQRLDEPFAFFGHSMGAIIGFELAHELRVRRGPTLRHLFVSGCAAPHIPDSLPPMHKLPESELIARLKELGGTPPEVLEDPEIIQLVLPTLRADFQLLETWRYVDRGPLRCPVTAMGGVGDKFVSRADVYAWREHSNAEFSMCMFPGDHFFLQNCRKQMIETILVQLGSLAYLR